MIDVISLDKQFVAGTYNRFPVSVQYGKGSFLYDQSGKEYIDMGSGIGVTAFGISDDEWVKAVTDQLTKVQHTSNLYYTSPCVLLAKTLCERTGLKKVFFSNSGAEANECAIKTARKYAQDRRGKDCYKIITLKNSFHGRTITTLSATGQDCFHNTFTPLTDGFLYATANDLESVKSLVDDTVAGVMIEVVQGEGGVIALDNDFVVGVYELCKEKDLVFICDEVQTGNGRTGKLYGYMHYGVTPDIVTTAKGLGGGLPIGACMMGEKTQSVLGFGDHGSTYGGNPVCSAGALSVINRLDQKFLDGVEQKSKYVFDRLKKMKGVVSVSGKGLMIGFKTEKPAKEVVLSCIDGGVLCLTAKDKVRLLPALNIPLNVLEKALDVIEWACKP
ncbi:MAG: aspartate aminotransferase family protein [Clostridiales bacterium]|nr:aspartate aminotransferase family protein [Clostridiales bacterium]